MIMLPQVLVFSALLGISLTQNDFSGPIKCYNCSGEATNSTCADPIDKAKLDQKECDRGICLKWTKYDGDMLKLYRSCSSDLKFELTMIDGVCRTERNGNGWLCMCGKHLCNGSPDRSTQITVLTSLAAALVASAALIMGRIL